MKKPVKFSSEVRERAVRLVGECRASHPSQWAAIESIAAKIGNEGWSIGFELRAGSWHSAFETHYFYERLFPRIKPLASAEDVVLMREDSTFDSAQLLFAKAREQDRLAAQGRRLEFITKWNPRKQDKEAWVARTDAAGVFVETRPGKRVGLLSLSIERAWQKVKRSFRLVVQVTERTIDKKGQRLLVPGIELRGWWTTLDIPAAEVIDLYKHHGTHEQFHSVIKTDLDLERLPSGKFDTNDAIVHLASFAYNYLRLLGQLGLTGEIALIRHPAKRRRLKTVLQEIMVRGGEVSGACAQADPGLRPGRGGARECIHCVAGAIVASGFAVTLTSHATDSSQNSAHAEGRGLHGSAKMT